jgi:hypothetical protein
MIKFVKRGEKMARHKEFDEASFTKGNGAFLAKWI